MTKSSDEASAEAGKKTKAKIAIKIILKLDMFSQKYGIIYALLRNLA